MGVFKNEVGRPSNETIKKRNIFKGICVLLVLVIVVLIAYILNDKGIINIDSKKLNDDNKKITTTAKVQENKITTEVIQKNTEMAYEDFDEDIMNLYLPFAYHTHEANKEELYKKDIIRPSDLSNEYKNRLAFAKYIQNNKMEKSKTFEDTDITIDGLSSESLNKSYIELFGTNVKYEAKSFDSYGIKTLSMTYDKKDNTYWADFAAGDMAVYRYANELYKVEKLDNKIELYEYVVVYNENSDFTKYGVFKNMEDANNFKNAIYTCSDDSLIYKTKENQKYKMWYFDDLSQFKEDASQYKLTFIKNEDGNYIFESVKKLNN